MAQPLSQVLLADNLQPQGTPGRRTLLALGCVLVLLFLAGVVTGRLAGSTSSTTMPSSTATAPPAASTTSTTTKTATSDAVLLALLGTGTLLILCGALYTRLSVIKLPGGGEIDLSPIEKTAVVAAVAAKLATPHGVAEPSASDVAQATTEALDRARTAKNVPGQPLDDDQIDKAVREAAKSITT